jgi:hypothetical protein
VRVSRAPAQICQLERATNATGLFHFLAEGASTPREAYAGAVRRLAQLPVAGVVFVCLTWIVLCVLVPLLWVAIKLQLEMAGQLAVVVPPVSLCLAWFAARRRELYRHESPTLR